MVTFCSFVAAWSLRVGIKVDVGMLVTYFLTCHMVFLLALFMYSFHFFSLARAISRSYSFDLDFHIALSAACFVRPYLFLHQFASFRALAISLFHHRLLCGLGRLRGVVSCTAFVIALTSCSANLSMSVVVVASLLIAVRSSR